MEQIRVVELLPESVVSVLDWNRHLPTFKPSGQTSGSHPCKLNLLLIAMNGILGIVQNTFARTS